MCFSLIQLAVESRDLSPAENKITDVTSYTGNVYRELQGLYREIGVQGFQIYGDCMYTRNPCNL